MRTRGFTLIELLVALTIFAVLSVLVFGSLGFTARAVTSGTVAGDRMDQLLLAQGFLRDRLQAAEPGGLEGAQGGLSFRAPVQSGTSRMTLVFERGQLLLRTTAETGETVLLDRVKDVALDYFGAPGADIPAQWNDRWAAAALPELVRLRLAFVDGAPVPDLVVAPRRVAIIPAVPARR